ncbi:MAG: FlgD immunoglobulin-like domain containing protein [bacterium]
MKSLRSPLLLLALLSLSCVGVVSAANTSAVATSPAATDTPSAGSGAAVGEVPVGTLLRPDGTLDLSGARRGPLDMRGYRMVPGPTGAPRFEPTLGGMRRAEEDPSGTGDAIAGGFGAQAPAATGPDGFWETDLNDLVNERVFAVAVDGTGNLYAVGAFTRIGGVAANYIAKWDGSRWWPLGTGLNRAANDVAVDAAGNVYAGGVFTNAGGVPASRVAKWNGTTWSALGTGITSNVLELAVDGAGNLYAGGGFLRAGGLICNNIAKWNGTAWSAMGTGVDGFVYALCVDGAGGVYAGGVFASAGGVPANNIARWNGSAWSAVGAGVSNTVEAIARTSTGDLYAAGPALGVMRWSGTLWNHIGGDSYNPVYTLAADATGNLYAGGGFFLLDGVSVDNFAKYNGSSWSSAGDRVPYVVFDLVADGSGVIHGSGSYLDINYAPARYAPSNIMKWIGVHWTPLAAGVGDGIMALSSDHSGNLYAGGSFSIAGGVAANRVARWTGTSWSALGSGVNGQVNAIVADSVGNVYVGGSFTTAGGVAANNVAKWDGTSWSALGAGVNASVAALALDAAGNLYVGGLFTSAGGVAATGIAKWSGSTWSAMGSGFSMLAHALAVDGAGTLYAGGADLSGGLVKRWDGGAWHLVGDKPYFDEAVSALAVDRTGRLYAGGSFTNASDHVAFVTLEGVAQLNGSSWQAMGQGIGYGVTSLVTDDAGMLFAGGTPTGSGVDLGLNHIARWDGAAWSPLYSGLDASVTALALDRGAGRLFVGGGFGRAYYVGPWPRLISATVAYPITASALANGSIVPNGRVMASRDGNQSFEFAPASGYQVADVLVDGVSVGAPSSYTFTNVTGPHTIAVSFAAASLGVEPGSPRVTRLAPAAPNPFRASTALRFTLARPCRGELAVFSVNGTRVRSLWSGPRAAGEHRIEWDGRDDAGRALREGIYFVRLVTPEGSQTRVVSLLR